MELKKTQPKAIRKKRVVVERDDRFQLENELLDHIFGRVLPLMKESSYIHEKIDKADEELTDTFIKVSTAFVTIGVPSLFASYSLKASVFNRNSLAVASVVITSLGILGLVFAFRKKYKLRDSRLGDRIDELEQIRSYLDIVAGYSSQRLKEVEEAFRKAGVKISK